MLYVVKKNSKISFSSRTPFMHNNQTCARLVYIYIYNYIFNLHTCIQMYQCLSSSSASTFKVHRTHGSTTIHTTELQAVHLSSLQTKAASSTTGTVKTSKPPCDLPSAQHLSSYHKVEPKKSQSGARCGTR